MFSHNRSIAMASAFGVRLRRLREAKKLTLQQVADAVGCTKAYIWELEMKEGQRPSAERVHALAKVLGVTMEDLMGEGVAHVPEASPEDVVFFREYAGMSDEEKQRYRQAMKLMFGTRTEGGAKE
jgi:transcriptional regulator with XRE-family HTH domain